MWLEEGLEICRTGEERNGTGEAISKIPPKATFYTETSEDGL